MKKLFGIIGNPIEHSLSPLLHNYWFKKYNIEATYSIIDIKEEKLESIIDKMKDRSLSGVNVTLPYKQKIINYTDKIVNDAKKTGSVNTLLLGNNNLVTGENTDVFGLQAAYLKEIDNGINQKALIIGAGGVSPSVILSLQKSGIRQISIINRTKEKCLFLKKSFNYINILPWNNLENEIGNHDLIINATSLGLKLNDKINLDFSKVGSDKFFYDVIYNPTETDFLNKGQKLDNRTENGKKMFIYQAAAAFKIWHGIEPKINNDVIALLD